MKNIVGLITGGRWHKEAYHFLKNLKKKIIVFDDNPKCFLKKNIRTIDLKKISEVKSYKNNIFLWSPCNDLGASLADELNNKKYLKRVTNFEIINNKKKLYSLLNFKKLYVTKIKKNTKYIKKKINGSGSRDINFFYWKKNYKLSKFYFLQEYIKGFEFSVEVYSYNKNHKVLSISYRILKNYKSAIVIFSMGYDKKIFKYFDDKIAKILSKIKAKNGISHIEIIIDNLGNIYPIDINIRMGGAAIAAIFLPNILNLKTFKCDFETLESKKKVSKFTKPKQGIIIYENVKNDHIKKPLISFSKYGIYEKLNSPSNTTKYELDKNRTSYLFFSSSDSRLFFKKLEKIVSQNIYKDVLSIKYKLKKILDNAA